MSQATQKQPTWDALGLPEPGTSLSRDAFDRLPEVQFHMEWHDGVVVYPNWNEAAMSPAPSVRHQSTVIQVIQLLLAHIPDGKVLTAPTDVHLGNMTVQPDVFWVAADSQCVETDAAFIGPPNLVVEVLSPSNTQNDRVTKFDLYEKQGVQEYWIINPDEQYLEIYVLDAGKYRRIGAYNPKQTFTSPALNTGIAAKAIFDV